MQEIEGKLYRGIGNQYLPSASMRELLRALDLGYRVEDWRACKCVLAAQHHVFVVKFCAHLLAIDVWKSYSAEFGFRVLDQSHAIELHNTISKY